VAGETPISGWRFAREVFFDKRRPENKPTASINRRRKTRAKTKRDRLLMMSSAAQSQPPVRLVCDTILVVSGWPMPDGAVSNLLLPLLMGTMCVLIGAVLLRADATSIGKRVLAGIGATQAAEQAVGVSRDRPSRSVAGALRAGPGLISAEIAQDVVPLLAADLRAVSPGPELSSLAALFSGAMRPSVPPAFRRAIGSGAPSSFSGIARSAPPGPGNTAR
jgi:hypothetical protein